MADGVCTLILGDVHEPKIRKLVDVLSTYFLKVEVAANVTECDVICRALRPAFVVFTDTMHEGGALAMEVRRHFPMAGLVGVFDQVRPEIEMGLRCAGTLFLGSYETFYSLSKAIVEPFIASARTRWM